MNFIQTTLRVIEVGKGEILVRLIPLLAAVVVIAGAYDFVVYKGLCDPQSMDNAQVARQISRGQGFTTEFLRPQAVAQLRDFNASQSLNAAGPHYLFPPDRFPPGAPRILPDTYNAPGYPFLLAIWFKLVHPEFEQLSTAMSSSHTYSADRWIPILNQGFLLLTAVLVFALGRRLFDDRVAWLALIAFLGNDLVWHYTLTGLSTCVLMFLVTAMLMCTMEIFCVGEACFASEDKSFAPAWIWGFAVALLLAAACLTRLHLLILLVPLFVALLLMPRASLFLVVAIGLIVAGIVAPWFIHMNAISGNPLGSNLPQVLYGEGSFTGNQIYCQTSIPSNELLFRDAISKEFSGFRWHFENAWNLLGASPMILLFAVSIFHQFKRRRTRLFQWLIFQCVIAIILANNLGAAKPETLGPWNTVVILVPCMLVYGTAYFFILLDRLNLQMQLLSSMIVVSTVAVTVAPLLMTLTTPNNFYYAFPPYMPPAIKSLSQFAQPDEWVTSDMPWATAWYADRASLWLPDSITDFENLHDNVCPTGIMLLTPITWTEPLSNFTSGEYKDWLPLVVQPPQGQQGLPLPTGFPLTSHSVTAPGGPDYSIWSDRLRWQQK
jgi:4-amino-4-deoxy-L-arabinose transferase-like glycosyltransferase